MSNLRVRPKAPSEDGCILEVTPQSAGWDYVGFAVHKLEAGETLKKLEADKETCLGTTDRNGNRRCRRSTL